MLARFWNNASGGVAPMLALTLIHSLGAVGAAIDFSRANAARAVFQAALDSTALTLSKKATTDTAAQLNSIATATVTTLFNRPDVSNVTVTANYTSTAGSKIVLTGGATVTTNFLSMFGYDSLPVSA
jgi:Flp pilus assembly protein TadG